MNKRPDPVYFSVILCLLCLLSVPAQALHRHTQIPNSVHELMNRYNIPRDSLSLYIVDLDLDHPLVEINPDKPRHPASVIKLLTTYAALELLRPNYTWETRFYIDGKLKDGILDGDLILQGGGDPFLTREKFWHMLHTLRARGISHITGDLVIDDSLFEIEQGSPGDFDNHPYAVYNTFPYAALVNFQAQQFLVVPQDKQVLIYADPPADNLEIRNHMKLVSGRCYQPGTGIDMHVSQQNSHIVATFSGKYPAACGERELLRSIIPSDQYVYGVFKSLWEEMGGTIDGGYRTGAAGLPDKPFYLEVSNPLSDIIISINKFSNNVMARQLLLTIGQIKRGTPGSKASGVETIREWLESINIHAPELVLENGSGLSRDTQISARNLGKLLVHAWRSPLQPEFMSSLPIAGLDGTMRKRLRKDVPVGNLRIKTGLLRSVRSMAGYVRSESGKQYMVVCMQNYPGIQNTTGTLIQDELLKWLYQQ